MTARGDIIAYGGTVKDVVPALGVKVLLVSTPSGFVGGTDNFTIDLNDYGCTKVHAIFASSQTTTGTVLVASTAAVTGTSNGVITITTGSNGTNVYGVVIYAY